MRPKLRRFILGVGAGSVAVAVSYALRALLGGIFLPEVAVNVLSTQTPGAIESVLVSNLQYLAKYTAFTVGIVVNVALYGALAAVTAGRTAKKGYSDRFSIYMFASYGTMLLIALVLLSLTTVLSTPQPLPSVILVLLPPQVAFGLALIAEEKYAPPTLLQAGTQAGVLCEPLKPMKSRSGKKFDRKRRLLIRGGVAAAVAGVLLYYGVNLLFPRTSTPSSSGGGDPVATLYAQEVTPTGNFYRVDVNIFPPSVDSSTWSLPITGLVSNPMILSYSQITAMDSVQQYNTLECVSNDVGGDLISTGLWTGVKLKDLLAQAQVQPSATYVVFRGTDGYDVGIPIEKAMLDETILAYQLNGAPLPQEHGYPLRAIVPGYYGMMNCKWIVGIELQSETYLGYWQRQGWINEASYETMSSIVTPGSAQIQDRFGIPPLPNVPLGMTPIAGIAFAGNRGIEKVEVSTDGGNTWTPASVKDPLSDNTWVLWTSDWNPPSTGHYVLAVRATDGTGAVQTAVFSTPFPGGATGYHMVDVGIQSS